jgi:hypothetical protein
VLAVSCVGWRACSRRSTVHDEVDRSSTDSGHSTERGGWTFVESNGNSYFATIQIIECLILISLIRLLTDTSKQMLQDYIGLKKNSLIVFLFDLSTPSSINFPLLITF